MYSQELWSGLPAEHDIFTISILKCVKLTNWEAVEVENSIFKVSLSSLYWSKFSSIYT